VRPRRYRRWWRRRRACCHCRDRPRCSALPAERENLLATVRIGPAYRNGGGFEAGTWPGSSTRTPSLLPLSSEWARARCGEDRRLAEADEDDLGEESESSPMASALDLGRAEATR
jgi:hypothetical protein